MSLTFTTQWEHSHIQPNEGHSHLVITVRASDQVTSGRTPLDLAFALDRSGSMHGQDKLDLVKQAVHAAVTQLNDTDRVALVVSMTPWRPGID